MTPVAASFPPALTRESIRAAALNWLGVREGDPRLPANSSTVPWCAWWASTVLREAGAACPVEWSAARLVDWWCMRGHELPPQCALYRVGDLVLFVRHDREGAAVGHHVAIVLADDGGPEITIVSGNTHAAPGGPTDCVAIGRRRRGEVVRAARPIPA